MVVCLRYAGKFGTVYTAANLQHAVFNIRNALTITACTPVEPVCDAESGPTRIRRLKNRPQHAGHVSSTMSIGRQHIVWVSHPVTRHQSFRTVAFPAIRLLNCRYHRPNVLNKLLTKYKLQTMFCGDCIRLKTCEGRTSSWFFEPNYVVELLGLLRSAVWLSLQVRVRRISIVCVHSYLKHSLTNG